MKDQYICPTCKTKNDEEHKWCSNCGTWLLSETFPAIKHKTKQSSGKGNKKTLLGLLVIIGFAIIGFYSTGGYSNGGMVQKSDKLTFNDFQVGDFKLSQIVIRHPSESKTSMLADLTNTTDLQKPGLYEVAASFYNSAGSRIGKASSLVTDPIAAGATRTITFEFEDKEDLSRTSSLRVEISTLSPLELLTKAAEKAKNLK